MTNDFLLNWAILSLSLFNTVLQLWLGLTILFNAERRSWGIWLAGGGLLAGAAFFVSHSAILGRGLNDLSQGMDFWWHVGWVPVIALPFAWYMIMLWYAGYWADGQSRLHRRQRLWFAIAVALLLSLVILFLFANPLASYAQAVQLDLSGAPAVAGVPLLVPVFSLYIVFCISLSLDVLRHPAPSERVMGDLARQRAHPWLVATALTLLLASLLVAAVILWVVLNAPTLARAGLVGDSTLTLAWFDLAIASLIALAVLLLGQAVVSYEIFTGKTLPRRRFRRYWRNAVILAAGFGTVISWSVNSQLHSIYGLLLATALVTIFYALFSWRSYLEREWYLERLSPFVASQRLHEHLLTPAASTVDVEVRTPFQALCTDVLGAQRAYLVAAGPLASLVSAPLTYPAAHLALPSLSDLLAQVQSPTTLCVPLNPAAYAGALWAVPLWSERGVIGLFLLGEKSDGGLYAQEEIEMARASGERLLDAQASAELAARLMSLQRQRLAESQVLDRRARRILHDEVLPQLHTAMLALGSQEDEGRRTKDESQKRENCSSQPGLPSPLGRAAVGNALGSAQGEDTGSSLHSSPFVLRPESALDLLTDVHRQLSNLLREMPTTAAPEVARLGLLGALRKLVEEEFAGTFEQVTWQIADSAAQNVAAIPSLPAEVVFYAAREGIRNASRHARPSYSTQPLHLTVTAAWQAGLQLVIADDGMGLSNGERENGTGGQGLALHSTMMAVVGGTLTVDSAPGSGVRVVLLLPMVGGGVS